MRFGAVVILGVAGIGLRPVGIALWPAVMLHIAITVWCVSTWQFFLGKANRKDGDDRTAGPTVKVLLSELREGGAQWGARNLN